MKKRFKNMEEVYKEAEKTAKEQAYQRVDTKDSPEKIADYTIASSHEEKFNDSVDGQKVEAEWEKIDEKEDAKKEIESEQEGKTGHHVKGVLHGTYNSVTAFGTSAAASILGNEALNKTGIPRALEQGVNAAMYEVGKGIFKDNTRDRVRTISNKSAGDERGR